MKKYDKSLRKYFWTGLRDVDSRGEYSWATVGGIKQAVTFSNWNFLEPGEWAFKVEQWLLKHSIPPKYVLHLLLKCVGIDDF